MKHACFLLLWLCCCAGLPTASGQLTVNPVLTGPNIGKYSFSINPTPLPNFNKPLVNQYYLVFINTGDGNYFRGTYLKAGNALANADLSTFYHPYKSTGTVKPYAELVEVYDDGNKPMRIRPVTTTVNVTANTSSVMPVVPPMGNAMITLDWVRRVVRNHENTYIVNVKNTSNASGSYQVQFTYDTKVFDYETNVNTGYTITQNTSTKLLTATIPTLNANAQTSVFFTLVTKLNPVLTAGKVVGPSAQLFKKGIPTNNGYGPIGGPVTANGIMVELAHDPNHKTPSVQVLSATNEWIEYRIEFQNDGAGKATHVHISDELDTLLLDKAPIFIGASHPLKVTTTPIWVAPRTWQWSFDDIELMGTNDPTYTAEQESKTKGWLTFKVQVRQTIPCQAIVNRARIIFECNAPVYTDFAYVRLNNANGAGCEESAPQALPVVVGVNMGASMANLFDANLGAALQSNGYNSYKWYPALQLVNPLSTSTASTKLLMARPESYVLIAAKNGMRQIFSVSVKPPNANSDSPVLVQDIPGDCAANLSFFGGKPPYSFVWLPSMPPPATAQPFVTYLDLSGKPNMQITVTDARGCQVVFSPIKSGLCRVTVGEPIQVDPAVIRH